MEKIIKRTMLIILALVVIFGTTLFFFLRQPKFGKEPKGERLERIQKSANYKDGEFQNINETPMIQRSGSHFSIIKKFILADNKPSGSIPTKKTDLLKLKDDEDVLIWFGHSSFFMQIAGKKILVDPVLSGRASPVWFTTKAFAGTDPYSVDDLPEIDYLFISHDHWDHLDYETILKLKPKVKQVICGLGVGEYFEHWGYDENVIIEKDWYEKIELDDGFVTHVMPARHFSGRSFVRNKSLWASFVLETPNIRIFISGDSGYDNHFAKIGKSFDGFDLAILENGQYNEGWKYTHMMPNQTLQAAKDLGAKRLLPVHNSKFVLALHPWNESLQKITELNKEAKIPLVTPMIGEKVNLNDETQIFSTWWEQTKKE